MKFNGTPLPQTLDIWLLSFIPQNVLGFTAPWPGHAGQTLWSGRLAGGITWRGAPLTNNRDFNTPPDPNASFLAKFKVTLTFSVNAGTVSATATGSAFTGGIAFVDPGTGAELSNPPHTCSTKVTCTKKGQSFVVNVEATARPAGFTPPVGLSGQFVINCTAQAVSEIVFNGGVVGFPAHECFLRFDGGPTVPFLQVECDGEAASQWGSLLGYKRPIFFDLGSQPPVTSAFLSGVGMTTFRTAAALDAYFQQRFGKTFLEWFNAAVALKGAWGGTQGTKLDKSTLGKTRLTCFINFLPEIFGVADVNFLQLVTIMSIAATETMGFSKFVELKDGKKQLRYFYEPPLSYDKKETALGNASVYELLSTSPYTYWTAHKSKAGSAPFNPANPNFQANVDTWKPKNYPVKWSFEDNDAANGFIMQADFFKFIGRGTVHITGRSNYKLLIDYIQNYPGTNPLIVRYRDVEWKNKPIESVATESKCEQWKELLDTDPLCEMASRAADIHSRNNGNYLRTLATTEAGLKAGKTTPGSLAYVASKVNAAGFYRVKFIGRVSNFCQALM